MKVLRITEVRTKAEITEDERKIVLRLSKGEIPIKIAADLGLNHNTFASVLREMRHKYNCVNTTHLVSYFFRNGIIN